MSDAQLRVAIDLLVIDERRGMANFLRHLAEMDHRSLPIKDAYPSTYMYLVTHHKLAEGEAYRRVRAMQAARRYKRIYAMLEKGQISLTGLSMLQPQLNDENYSSILDKAAGKSTRDIERLVAEWAPKPEPLERIRLLGPRPAPKPLPLLRAVSAQMPAPPPAPVEHRVHLSFNADEGLVRKIKRAREVRWHKYPSGRLEDVFNDALETLLERYDPARRIAGKKRPRTGGGAGRLGGGG